MSRTLIFPDATARGDRWDVYAGDQTIISPQEAALIGSEALMLCERHDASPLSFCAKSQLNPSDGEGDNYSLYEFWLQSNRREHLLNQATREIIPRIIAFVGLVEQATGQERESFLINVVPANGRIGRHRDIVEETVVAVNLIGSGRVTVANANRLRRRFRTGPGNGMVLHNFGEESLRPAHSVSARGGPRISLAL